MNNPGRTLKADFSYLRSETHSRASEDLTSQKSQGLFISSKEISKTDKGNKHTAFTLTEILIALGVIAVLTVILMSIISLILPSHNVLMAKRAYFTTEAIVSDMMNDPWCYPATSVNVGFDDGRGYAKCKDYGGTNNPSKLDTQNSAEKFVTLFAANLNLKEDVSYESGKYRFKSRDGIEWIFSDINFVTGNGDSFAVLTVDVNPKSKSPNCGESKYSPQCESSNENYDQFSMKIYARGKIELLDCWAARAIRSDKKLVGKDTILPSDCSFLDYDEDSELSDSDDGGYYNYDDGEYSNSEDRIAKRRQFDKWKFASIGGDSSEDYYMTWDEAVEVCGGAENLPDEDDLWEFAKTIYTDCNEDTKRCTGLNADNVPQKLKDAGFISSWATLWSGVEESSSRVRYREFDRNISYAQSEYRVRWYRAVCVGDL